MPYLSSKIPIAGTQYDRRIKLTNEQKEYIRWLRSEEQLSYNKLAKMFGVSKKLILVVCKPEIIIRERERRKELAADGRYRYTKEKWAETVREHRRYKQQLKVEGKI